MVDYQLFGLRAWGHHLHNVLLHSISTLLLFFVLWRMTDGLWPSAFVATVFAVHPMRVESVAWVTERKDMLGGLFFLLAPAAYLGYLYRRRWGVWYGAMCVSFALGLLAKPIVITFPFVLLLLDYWPLGRMTGSPPEVGQQSQLPPQSFWRLVVEKLPLICAGGQFMRADDLGSRQRLRDGRRPHLVVAVAKCLDFLRFLFLSVLLSGWFGGHVSPATARLAAGPSHRIRTAAADYHPHRVGLAAKVSVSAGRLAVVRGDAGPYGRFRAIRHSVRGRPLYVPAANRAGDCRNVGRGRSLPPVALWRLAVRSGCGRRIASDDFGCSATSVLLAQQRDSVESRSGLQPGGIPPPT